MTIVNRVPTLHRPPGPDATMPEIIAYWQRRHPAIDWAATIDTALLEVAILLGCHIGLGWPAIWQMYEQMTFWRIPDDPFDASTWTDPEVTT
ncbi:hypothetical protein SEA_CLOWN_3 [Gordonia phage Clown]|uniref:Uncharacterized protein n=1 Tax=Gordonia phage Clown TaxID=2759393 RepID=A0A7L7SIC3_9CAUD|nr:hypothetical protein KNV25_gp03 [Gordonia phage Clown]QOC56001.1 hypothetical protein SEA_CLOWN_3 [Gordonia phage Clown]